LWVFGWRTKKKKKISSIRGRGKNFRKFQGFGLPKKREGDWEGKEREKGRKRSIRKVPVLMGEKKIVGGLRVKGGRKEKMKIGTGTREGGSKRRGGAAGYVRK